MLYDDDSRAWFVGFTDALEYVPRILVRTAHVVLFLTIRLRHGSSCKAAVSEHGAGGGEVAVFSYRHALGSEYGSDAEGEK